MSTTSARPGPPWGGSSFAHVPMPSSSFPPLVWPPMARRRYFCARVQQGRGEVKRKTAVKAICRPCMAFYILAVSLYSYSVKQRTAAPRACKKGKERHPTSSSRRMSLSCA
nr:MAG TPA: hypothetical protein [Caudoviricetes sp.]